MVFFVKFFFTLKHGVITQIYTTLEQHVGAETQKTPGGAYQKTEWRSVTFFLVFFLTSSVDVLQTTSHTTTNIQKLTVETIEKNVQ